MKIVDCFTFYNELDMLKFRLEYLYETVDHFVLVEATLTHAGRPKPLFFESNKSMFSKYLHKIVHIVVSDMPVEPKPILYQKFKKHNYTITRENHQRECIKRGVQMLNLTDNDVLIISDCDEIPDRDTIKNAKIDKLYSLDQDLYYYNITLQQKDKWRQSKILDYRTYKNYKNPQLIRISEYSTVLEKGGWHFSYFGNIDFIVNKIRNFCHYDMFENLTKEQIRERIESGKFLLDTCFSELIKIPLEENDYLPEGYQVLLTMF